MTSVILPGNAKADYGFVDGAALRGLIERTKDAFGIPASTPFNFGSFFARETKNASRVFYYDAYPDRKASASDSDHDKLYTETEALFDRVNSYEGVHVRHGMARYRDKRQQQKGVDILLAIDVYQHAVNGLEHAYIFANDGDFYPVLEALRSTKTRSVLKCVRGKTPKYLYEVADIVSYINELNVVVHFEGVNEKRYRVNVTPRADERGLISNGYSVTSELHDSKTSAPLFKVYTRSGRRRSGRCPAVHATDHVSLPGRPSDHQIAGARAEHRNKAGALRHPLAQRF